jgi:NAD(P)-dependent dehydrogenase (short-subunit alcohol dehydrogenase family)
MAIDFAADNIRVNMVCPEMVYAPMTASYLEKPEDAERIAYSMPLGRAGKPEEITAVILFLASDDASFVTGAVLPADGGFTAGKGHWSSRSSSGWGGGWPVRRQKAALHLLENEN